MGGWGSRPWQNDEAADWFHEFWKPRDIAFLINEINNFDEKQERYDSFRAASYVLQAFGSPYMWPAQHREILKELLDKSIDVLEKMINPPSDDWGFLDMWGNNQEVIDSVRDQINQLKLRRSEIVF